MGTTTELCEVLASSLGIEPEIVADHVRFLHDAGGRFPADKGGTDSIHAEPGHAVALLISLMSGCPPAKAPDAVRLYSGLPLDCAHRGAVQPAGQVISEKIQEGTPFMATLMAWGSTYGEFLAALIDWFNEAPEVDFEVISFVMGGGPGTSFALIYYGVLIEGENVVGDVKFSYCTDALSHDGPRVRLEKQTIVPGTILPILREFFTGTSGGPKEVFISRADLAHLAGGGTV